MDTVQLIQGLQSCDRGFNVPRVRLTPFRVFSAIGCPTLQKKKEFQGRSTEVKGQNVMQKPMAGEHAHACDLPCSTLTVVRKISPGSAHYRNEETGLDLDLPVTWTPGGGASQAAEPVAGVGLVLLGVGLRDRGRDCGPWIPPLDEHCRYGRGEVE